MSESWQAERAPRIVVAQPITPTAFGRYGDVLVPPAKVGRVDFLAEFTNARAAARPNIAMVRSELITAPFRVVEMERHPFSAQIFIPVEVGAYLVVVAEDDGEGAPDLATLAAFRIEHPLGVGYRAGVWHINMVALSGAGTFALLVHEDGTPDDCHFKAVAPFRVLLHEDGSPAT